MALVSTDDPMRVAQEAGFHRLAIPTPFAMGDVNAYLVVAERLALIDSGPNAATSLVALERRLAALGRAVEDVEVLVVTHPHVDHIGLAGIVADRSGAEVVVFEDAVPIARDFPRYAGAADDYAAEIMLAHGVEPHVARTLRDMASLLTGWGASTAVHRAVADGDVVDLGNRALAVRHCPGHSPYDIALTDEDAGVVAWADHLIDTISSNALITRMAEGPERTRPTPLLDYRRSLRASRAVDLRVALPGHGGAITDHRALIDERLADQDARADHLLELLADGPRSAHELAQAIWGPVAISQAYLTLSEVLGHLDILIARGTAEEQQGDDVIRFAARAAA